MTGPEVRSDRQRCGPLAYGLCGWLVGDIWRHRAPFVARSRIEFRGRCGRRVIASGEGPEFACDRQHVLIAVGEFRVGVSLGIAEPQEVRAARRTEGPDRVRPEVSPLCPFTADDPVARVSVGEPGTSVALGMTTAELHQTGRSPV